MKLCLDVKDEYEKVFEKLTEEQKKELLKGLSNHANAVLGILDHSYGQELDAILNILTSAMKLLAVISSEGGEEE